MKNLQLYTILILVAVSTFIFQNAGAEPQPIQSFSQIKSMFKSPPVEYQSAPLWVWNDDLNEAEIDDQLKDMQIGGIGGVFIHPRPGLITPYLSDRWFELCRYTVDKAKEMGMEVWLYDENSYPSGFAGGNVPAEMPESYNQGQGMKMHQVKTLPDDAQEKYFIILKKAGDKFVDITDKLAGEKGKTGDYYLFEKTFYKNSSWNGGYSYVDLLVPGVTEKFLEVTMTGYEKAIGDEFGKIVPGIFTDEPNINPRGGAKFTPSIFKDFQARWGYDLKTNLPSLFIETGDWRVVRHNFYSLLLDLFIDRWSKPYFEYTEKHNLKWTGHYWEHGWPKLDDGPDNMAMYAWHQMPAIDLLMNQYNESVNAQFGNVRIVKELASVANQMGRNRTLSETYGAGGWDLRFADMKRIGDWEYVLGVNFLNQHLSYITINGARKRDHPQSFSYHEPWWNLYKASANYFSRLSLALSSGEQVNDILILEPTTTAWMYYSPDEPDQKFNQLGPEFQKFVTELEHYQIEYDLGSENIIKNHGKIKGPQFIVGERTYKLVVLPPTLQNIDSEVLTLLKNFVANGGQVLSFVEPPQFVNGKNSTEPADLAKKNAANWMFAENVNDAKTLQQLEPQNIQFNDPEKIDGILFHHRRVLDDGQVVFLVNTSDEKWSTGSFAINGKSVQEMGLDCGCLSDYPAKAANGKLDITFDLPPAGSLLLFVGNSGKNKQPEIAKAKIEIMDSVSPLEIKRVAPNTLTIDWCDLTLEGKKYEDVYFFNATDKVFKHYGFDGDPWSTSVQYKTAILDRDNFPKDSGFSADFYFDVTDDVNYASIKVAVERPQLWQLSINNVLVEANPGESWLDRAMGVYEIGKYVNAGRNKITLTTSPMTIHTELEPIYVFGDFALESQEKGWKIVPAQTLVLDSWKSQGLPFYSNIVEYTKTYTVNSTDKRHIVKLTDWLGSVAQVKVNGKDAGVIISQPYELDVTNLVKKGENTISVSVYGTLKNLLGPHHIGVVRGTAWPSSFQSAPENMPAGSDYDLIDYGLFKDFLLIESTGPKQRVYWRDFKVSTPVIKASNEIGVDAPVIVDLSTFTQGAALRYTLDGSGPTETSEIYTDPLTIRKSTTIKAKAFKKNMIESELAESAVHIVNSKVNGINYEYFEGVWEDIPDFNSLKAQKTGHIYDIDIQKLKNRNDQFAFRFAGNLEIDTAGEYTFFLNSNDGSNLYINKKLVVNNGGAHGLQERQGNVGLEKGSHPIQIDYFDSGGSNVLEVCYKGPGIEKQLLPPDKLLLN